MYTLPPKSAILKVVEHLGGPAECARKLGLVHQQTSMWVWQGYAPASHLLTLEPHLPDSISLRDLLVDREVALRRMKRKPAAKRRVS
jgi:hypothetical protein